MKSRVPVLTLLIAALAITIYFVSASHRALVLDRGRVSDGEVWRLWTGHLVHFSQSHLAWDVFVFVACGSWIERRRRANLVKLLTFSAGAISFALLVGLPEMRAYGGLSGLNMALLTFLGMGCLRDEVSRSLGIAVLGCVALKLFLEMIGVASPFASFNQTVRPVPLSHLTGACTGLIAAILLSEKFSVRPIEAPRLS